MAAQAWCCMHAGMKSLPVVARVGQFEHGSAGIPPAIVVASAMPWTHDSTFVQVRAFCV